MATSESTQVGSGAKIPEASEETGAAAQAVTFERHPSTYKHWRLSVDGPVATLAMDVDPDGGFAPGYTLKLNSYDLGVDIELHDAVQRLRFEHPEVHVVVLTSAQDKVFSAGANIRMLGRSTHHHKVNFCKLTNETRNAMEDASEHSGQVYLCALNGTASGGGYELALAAEEIILIDDRSSAVSLPEVPLLGVLPGTGGLTRVVDKRKVRRDRADVFSTRAEGLRGEQARAWGLVDFVAPRSRFEAVVKERALELAARSDRPATGPGVELTPLRRTFEGNTIRYDHLEAVLQPELGVVTVTVSGPQTPLPADAEAILEAGDGFWPLAFARQLDDLLLHLRFNEPKLGTIAFRSVGDPAAVLSADRLLASNLDHWLVREIVLFLKRTLKRLDLSSRSIFALVEPGSCFAGTLAELVFAADRSYMLDGTFEDQDAPPAALVLSDVNLGWYPMANGLSRLATRFWGHDQELEAVRAAVHTPLQAAEAADLGLVTFTPDDIDWEDEVRLALEERASFSPDALTGMEANYRFPGPETMETKIFGRLSAWQNWIFQRPNASGPEGALQRYGTGTRAHFDETRV